MATGTAEKDLLVLSFAWEDAAHWQLTVNGAPAVLEPVFGGLMGVRLAPGEQHIRAALPPPPGAAAGLGGKRRQPGDRGRCGGSGSAAGASGPAPRHEQQREEPI